MWNLRIDRECLSFPSSSGEDRTRGREEGEEKGKKRIPSHTQEFCYVANGVWESPGRRETAEMVFCYFQRHFVFRNVCSFEKCSDGPRIL